jgi:hypothetical protein
VHRLFEVMKLDLSRYEIVQVPSSVEHSPEAFGPEVEGLLSDMRRLSRSESRDWPLPYQIELARRRTFRLNRDLTSGDSYLLKDKAVIYFFRESGAYAVIAANLAHGFPLLGLVDVRGELCYNLGDPTWGVRRDHLEQFSNVLATYHRDERLAPCPFLVTGNQNFAHVVWNQLGPLEKILAEPFVEGTRLLVTQEPLGPLPELIRGLPASIVDREADYNLEKANANPAASFISVGGSLITQALRERLVGQFVSQLSPAATELRRELAGRRVVILTLRSHNRTATNQADTLVALAEQILAEFPDARILLDGHSLPADRLTSLTFHKPHHDSVLEAQRSLAHEIRARLPRRSDAKVVSAIGLDIRESIALGETGRFYFAHHGTVQHKIGWFHRVPGVVHSNPKILALDPAFWVQDQSEGTIRPVYLPIEHVRAEDFAGDSAFSAALHHENYAFVSVPATVDFVMEHVREALQGVPEPSDAYL